MTRILMIIAPENFRDEEYFQPKQVFEREGFQVTTASTRTGPIKGMLGGIATSDLALQMVDPREYRAVVLVGGSGASVFFEDKKIHALLKDFAGQGKPTAAICVSPTTLANAGLLQGKQATVWNDPELVENLKDQGARYTGLAVTIDGPIITASGPPAAKEFAREIVEKLREEGR